MVGAGCRLVAACYARVRSHLAPNLAKASRRHHRGVQRRVFSLWHGICAELFSGRRRCCCWCCAAGEPARPSPSSLRGPTTSARAPVRRGSRCNARLSGWHGLWVRRCQRRRPPSRTALAGDPDDNGLCRSKSQPRMPAGGHGLALMHFCRHRKHRLRASEAVGSWWRSLPQRRLACITTIDGR